MDPDVYKFIESQEGSSFNEDFTIYLKCSVCKIFTIEPKFCYTCNKNYCNWCRNCSHNVVFPRAVKTIINQLKVKCKYFSNGCPNVLKLTEVKNHIFSCKFKAKEDINNRVKINFKDEFMDESLKNSNKFLKSLNHNDNYLKCPYCKESFKEEEELFNHYKNCQDFKNEVLNPSQNTSQYLEYQLNKINKLKYHYQRLNQTKFQDLLVKLINNTKYLDHVDLNQGKKEEKEKFHNESIKILEDSLNTKISNLRKVKETLIGKKEELKKFINSFEVMKEDNGKSEELAIQFQKDLLSKKLAKRKMNNKFNLFREDFLNSCIICKNNDQSVKKFYCKKCRNLFCENKCIIRCKALNCQSDEFICPVENAKCSLCQKMKNCDKCKKKCFYQGCKNLFCQDCYKKNEHQARGSSVSCKFFTCERDQRSDCLMTSLYCNKCEKRLCSYCLKNDDHVDHFK